MMRISDSDGLGKRRRQEQHCSHTFSSLISTCCILLLLLLVSADAFTPALQPTLTSPQRQNNAIQLRVSLVDEMMEKADSMMNPLLKTKNNNKERFLKEAAIDIEVADGVPPVSMINRDSDEEQESSNTLVHLAVAGALATAIGDGTMHPLDTIKTLQQSDAGYGLSMLQAANLLYDQAGWAGFYSGFFTYAMSDALGGSLKFVTFELGKRWTLGSSSSSTTSSVDLSTSDGTKLQQSSSLFACAALAFVASSIVVVPGELLKQQLQMNLYEGLPQAVAGTLERDGFGGLYTGYSGVFLRDIPYTMLELGLYDLFKNGFVNYKQKQQLKQASVSEEGAAVDTTPVLSTMEEILAAAFTGGIAGYFTTPFDTIKTKVMVDQQLYDGFLDCLQSTVDQYGFFALFAGGAARVAWLVPFTAIYLPVYDFLKRKLSSMSVANPATTVVVESEKQ